MKRLGRITALACLLALPACSGARPDSDWVEVKRDELLIEVDVSGTLRALDSDSIGPPGIPRVWNYKISMLAPEGSEVKEGEPILGFDVSELRRKLEQEVATYDSALKQVEKVQAEAKVSHRDSQLQLADARAQRRKAKLKADVPERLIALHELDKSRLDLDLADKRVEHLVGKARSSKASSQANVARWKRERDRAEQRVTQLREAIERMSIKAPRTGTIIYETNWRGEKKKVGDSCWRGATVMRVVSLAEMEGRGEVDEVDSSQISAGQEVALHLDAQPDTVLRGSIGSVARIVKRKSPENPLKVAELDITLVPDEKLRLRPGMRFRGRITTLTIADAIVVPNEAIIPSADGPMARLRIGPDSKLVAVELGQRNDDFVEIQAGLEVGDVIERVHLSSGGTPP